MRVLIATPLPYPGSSASAKHMRLVGKGLLSAGAEQVLILGSGKSSKTESGVDDAGISFESLPIPPRPRFLPGYPWHMWHYRHALASCLKQRLAEERWDSLIFDGRSSLVAEVAFPLLKHQGVAVVPYMLEWFVPRWRQIVNGCYFDEIVFWKRLIPRTHGLIAISRFWQEQGDRLCLPTVTIPSYADVDLEVRPGSCRAANEPFRIVFVGRWDYRELPLTLFVALQRAIARGVDVRLIVVGKVGKSQTEATAMRAFRRYSELVRRTEFTGFISDQQLRSHLASAHAFVLLREQNRETDALFPTRLPEYLLTSNPVICSSAGDLPNYLSHRQSAWLIPPGDSPGALAEAILHLAAHEDERQAIGRAGREVAVRELSYRVLGARMAAFLARLNPKPSGESTRAIGAGG